MGYAFDTNTVIHLMRGTPSVKANREIAKSACFSVEAVIA